MLNYSSFVSGLANLLVVPVNDPNFLVDLPNIIDDAEQRIYRELDLLNTVVSDASGQFTINQRQFNLPAAVGTFYVVNSIYAITPAGTGNPNLGTRNPLLPASRDFLDFAYPSANGSAVPAFFAMTTQTAIIVGPWPDQPYQAEINGTIRPPPLSSSNVTTILSVYLPDLFMAAAMVRGSGYQQNYGPAQGAENPQMAVTWESHYQALKASAATEEARKKFTGEGWSSRQPSQLATPPRN